MGGNEATCANGGDGHQLSLIARSSVSNSQGWLTMMRPIKRNEPPRILARPSAHPAIPNWWVSESVCGLAVQRNPVLATHKRTA